MQSFDSTERRDEDEQPESPFGGSIEPGFDSPHAAEDFGSGDLESVPFDASGSGAMDHAPIPVDPYQAAGFDPTAGNRPAEQARVTTPGEAFQDDWTGGEGAGDFLELDASLGEEGLDMAEAEQLEEERRALALAEDVPDGTPPGEHLFAAEEPRPYADEEYTSTYDGGEDPLAEYEEEDFSLEPEGETKKGLLRPGPLVAVGFGLGLVAVIAMTFMDEPTEPTPDGAVSRGGSEVTPGPKGTPSSGTKSGTELAATDPSSAPGASVEPAPRPPTPPSTFSAPLAVPPQTLMAQLPAMMTTASVLMVPIAPLSEVTEMPSFPGGFPTPPTGGPALALTGPGTRPQDPVAMPAPSTGQEPGGWSLPDPLDGAPTVDGELAGLETGEPMDPEALASLASLLRDTTVMYNLDVVPIERIYGPVQIKTPAVGNVRVALAEGDLFEGRLYAVGQGKVWLDTQLGRMGLQAEMIDSIERLVSDAQGGVVSVDPSQVGTRVRARTAGGYFISGRVVKVNGEDVTLVTDEGNRITIAATEVQALGTHPQVRLDL